MCRSGFAVGVTHTTRSYTQVSGINHYCHIIGMQYTLKFFRDLYGQPFLHLRSLGKILNNAIDFG